MEARKQCLGKELEGDPHSSTYKCQPHFYLHFEEKDPTGFFRSGSSSLSAAFRFGSDERGSSLWTDIWSMCFSILQGRELVREKIPLLFAFAWALHLKSACRCRLPVFEDSLHELLPLCLAFGHEVSVVLISMFTTASL